MAGMRERRAPVKMNMSKKYVNDLVGSSTPACQAEQGEQADKALQYSVTPQDVQAYLDTLKPGDNIGVSYNSAECLVARAIRHKYQRPDLWVCVETETISVDDGPEFLTPPDIRTIINAFDDVTSSCRPITKQEWLEAKEREEVHQ